MVLFYDDGLKQQDDYLIATDDNINKDPSVVTRFLRADIKGWTHSSWAVVLKRSFCFTFG